MQSPASLQYLPRLFRSKSVVQSSRLWICSASANDIIKRRHAEKRVHAHVHGLLLTGKSRLQQAKRKHGPSPPRAPTKKLEAERQLGIARATSASSSQTGALHDCMTAHDACTCTDGRVHSETHTHIYIHTHNTEQTQTHVPQPPPQPIPPPPCTPPVPHPTPHPGSQCNFRSRSCQLHSPDKPIYTQNLPDEMLFISGICPWAHFFLASLF